MKRGMACMTHYYTCMPHIDHTERLNIDPGPSRIPLKHAIWPIYIKGGLALYAL